jgi:hypothetical protein
MTPLTPLLPKTRDEVLATIDAVVKELRQVRATTAEPDSGFELAQSTLLGCRGAVQGSKDVEPLVHTLKKAAGALKVTAASDASSAVQRARTTLQTLWTALELNL